ncbi:phage major capsid protein [Aestuariicella hydrocarbonica]|uniref:Phage major capsid protein n=2 Tax=Pseudomaricurvus hydrocarbonicus TaxID=1470433 RepID=A0A9E5MJ74_9GAMM|nr:phage major capsid protein [Aestuariicella hydrocarbonica]
MTEHGVSFKRVAFGQLGEIGSDPVNVEQEYRRVSADLKNVGDQLKAFAESSKAELAKHQGLTEETKASVDKLLTEQGALNARLQAAEQALADGIDNMPTGVMSLGRRVIESEGFEANASRILTAKGAFSVPVQAALTTTQSDGANGYPVEPMRVPGVIAAPEQRLTIRDLLSWGRTTSNSIEYVRETGFTNGADVVSENPASNKPESTITFDLASAPVATIAHWVHASKQVLSDAGMLQSYIDGRLRYGLKLKEEAQLLKGSGVGLNISGIYTQASAYANPGVDVTADTGIDRLRIAMLQVQLAEYSADGIVLNPIDWAGIELTKDTQGKYIFANPLALAGPVLWGLPVVSTQSMDQGDFLTGAFRMGAQGWDREDANVMVSTEDRDNFVKNMVTILCEERVALTVYRPEAFVKGDFTIGSSGA